MGHNYARIGGKITPNFLQCSAQNDIKLHSSISVLRLLLCHQLNDAICNCNVTQEVKLPVKTKLYRGALTSSQCVE